MFPQFPHYPRRLFSRPDPLRDTPLSPQPDQQLQAELEQAAEVGMVATRSQDHTLDGIEVQDIIENGPPSIGTVTKRKNGYGEDSTPTKSADNKRRRISKSKVNEASKPIAAEPSEMNSKKQNRKASKRRTRESTPGEGTTLRDLTTASIPPPTASLAPKKRRSEILAGQEVMTSVVIKLKESTTSENPAHEGSEKVARNPMASQTTKRRKKPREDGEAKNRLPKKTMEVNKIRKAAVPDPTKTKSPAAKATKATHKRFGSEEIEVPEPQPQVKEGNGEEDRSLEESEDEAPETTTVSAEKEKAGMAAVETENAAARYAIQMKLPMKLD